MGAFPSLPPVVQDGVAQYGQQSVVSASRYPPQVESVTTAPYPDPPTPALVTTTPFSFSVPPPPPAPVAHATCTSGALSDTLLSSNSSMVRAPPQPQLHIVNGGDAIIVRWRSGG